MFPLDIRYTTTHEWVRLENNIATIGITKYAADQLSDITYIELPSVGDELVVEMAFGTIESVKAAEDLISPIDGEVVEANKAVVDNPELVSEDPYEDAWLIRAKASDLSQIDELMTAQAYQVFVQAEAGEPETEPAEEAEEEGDVEEAG
jgi:glycine cleavage system H protein